MKILKSLWERVKHNLGLKVICILVAVVLWMYITNTQDPYESRTFFDVPVTILNEEKLTQKDKIVEIIDGSTVTIEVEARRSILNSLTEANLLAVADFDKTSSLTETVPIEVSIVGVPSVGIEIVRPQNEYMKLSLQDYASKEFKVTIDTVGTPAEGYVMASSFASPNVITVSGSKMQLSRIQEVVVTVNVDSLSGTSTINLRPVVYDMNDEEILSDKLELSTSSIQVTTAIYPSRTVDVAVSTNGYTDSDYETNSIFRQPASVTIAGKPEELDAFFEKNYAIRAYIDVTGAKSDIEKTVDINTLIDKKLYPSIYVIDEDPMLAVKISITELQKRELYISEENLSIINQKEGYEYSIRNLSERQITVKATKSWLDGLTASSLRPTLDVGPIDSVGLITVQVRFGSFQGVEIVSPSVLTATVLIYQTDDQDEEPGDDWDENKFPENEPKPEG